MKKLIVSKTPNDIGSPQANFDRKKFDDFITDKGYKCTIERSMRCPCTADHPQGSANSDCKNCFGTGWFFIDMTETVLVCTSMSNRNKYEVWSQVNMGIVNISCRPQDRLGFMDRIILTDLESIFSQTVQLKNSITQANKLFSFLIYEPVYVYHVYLYIDSETPLKSLKESEYKIEGNKVVIESTVINEYISDGIPKITIKYAHNPTYHIIDVNRDLIKQKSIVDCSPDGNMAVTNFPINCVGKRAHYILDAKNYSGEGVFDNTDYTKQINYDR